MGATTSEADPTTIGTTGAGWHAGRVRTVCAGGAIVVLLLGAAALDSVATAPALALIMLVPAAVVDARERRLPDTWAAASLAVFLAATSIAVATGHPQPLLPMILGALVASGPILFLHLVSPAAMGFGDVKVAVVIGLAMGAVDWRLALVALTLAAGSAGVYGVAARARTVAFGPFLVAGATCALLFASTWLAPVADTGGHG